MAENIKEAADKVPSPCVRNCCLDDNDICIGCNRSLEEILAWHKASEDEKRQILLSCRQRRERRPDPWMPR
jgi:hypothetical protein